MTESPSQQPDPQAEQFKSNLVAAMGVFKKAKAAAKQIKESKKPPAKKAEALRGINLILEEQVVKPLEASRPFAAQNPKWAKDLETLIGIMQKRIDNNEAQAKEYEASPKDKEEKLMGAAGLGNMAGHGEKNKKLIIKLLEEGVDVNARAENGRTALTSAAIFGQTEMAQILIDHGADVNIQDKDGVTALILAAYMGSAPMVRLLLQHGANKNLKDNAGYTALDMAREKGVQESIGLLDGSIAVGEPELKPAEPELKPEPDSEPDPELESVLQVVPGPEASREAKEAFWGKVLEGRSDQWDSTTDYHDYWYMRMEEGKHEYQKIPKLNPKVIKTHLSPKVNADRIARRMTNAIEELDVDTARIIVENHPPTRYLCLDGLKKITPQVAKELAKNSCRIISLKSLEDIDDESLEILIRWASRMKELYGFFEGDHILFSEKLRKKTQQKESELNEQTQKELATEMEAYIPKVEKYLKEIFKEIGAGIRDFEWNKNKFFFTANIYIKGIKLGKIERGGGTHGSFPDYKIFIYGENNWSAEYPESDHSTLYYDHNQFQYYEYEFDEDFKEWLGKSLKEIEDNQRKEATEAPPPPPETLPTDLSLLPKLNNNGHVSIVLTGGRSTKESSKGGGLFDSINQLVYDPTTNTLAIVEVSRDIKVRGKKLNTRTKNNIPALKKELTLLTKETTDYHLNLTLESAEQIADMIISTLGPIEVEQDDAIVCQMKRPDGLFYYFPKKAKITSAKELVAYAQFRYGWRVSEEYQNDAKRHGRRPKGKETRARYSSNSHRQLRQSALVAGVLGKLKTLSPYELIMASTKIPQALAVLQNNTNITPEEIGKFMYLAKRLREDGRILRITSRDKITAIWGPSPQEPLGIPELSTVESEKSAKNNKKPRGKYKGEKLKNPHVYEKAIKEAFTKNEQGKPS